MQREYEVIRLGVTDSTNNEAKRLVLSGKTGDMLIIADEQTAGRGRLGRSFYSPAKTGLYMSLVLFGCGGYEQLLGATTAAAVAVCKAIEKLSDKKPGIKWVNDIYVENKKVCGILCETVSAENAPALIIGIGVNISTAEFPEGAEIGGSLMCDISRDGLANEIAKRLTDYAEEGFKGNIGYYREHSMLLGKEITVIKNGEEANALAVDINENGGLVIRRENGETETLTSAEVSVRRR